MLAWARGHPVGRGGPDRAGGGDEVLPAVRPRAAAACCACVPAGCGSSGPRSWPRRAPGPVVERAGDARRLRRVVEVLSALAESRGAGFSSIWFVLSPAGSRRAREPAQLDRRWAVRGWRASAIAVLALAAERRPRLPQLVFLVVAAFLLTNKVYSPQYVLWLMPLAVLARPRWRDLLIWQAGEVVHFVGIWMLIEGYPARAPRARARQRRLRRHRAGAHRRRRCGCVAWWCATSCVPRTTRCARRCRTVRPSTTRPAVSSTAPPTASGSSPPTDPA